MNKKIIIGSVIGIGVLIVPVISNLISSKSFETTEKIKIATCPTYYELSKSLNLEKYQVIKTSSTAQSLVLLESGQADMILAGRTLKPTEPQMDSLLIKEGYSFLSNQEATIFVDQLNGYNIYTDLDEEELKQKFPIKNIQAVASVDEYLDKGIIITSWENTDYNKASIVHLLEKNGERVKLSRQPTIYCPNACDEQARELALYLKNKHQVTK
ncbi:MAG: hypothetical protein WDZ85_00670 [Candidatus Paceibacterota bacterium]